MDNLLVKILEPKHFITFGQWIGKSHNVEAVFTAEYDTNQPGHSEELYIKIYPEHTKGLLNEIVGWLINYSCKIPQPQNCYIVKLDTSQILMDDELSKRFPLVKSIKEKYDTYYAFATSSIYGNPAGIELFDNIELLDTVKKDVQEWLYLHDAIVSDEKMANTDRHLNNLIRYGQNNYACIDNGRLCCDSTTWSITDIQNPLASFSNKLSNLFLEPPVSKDIANKLYRISEQPTPYPESIEEIFFWINTLVIDEKEKNAFTKYLTERLNNISNIISKRYDLVA